jgi:hypothetical protein
MREVLLATLAAIVSNALAAPAPTPTLEEQELPRATASREDFVALLMKLVPGRSTQQAAMRSLPAPALRSQRGKAEVYAYRLDVLAGEDYFDVFLVFKDGILVQMERPALDQSLTLDVIRKRYGTPQSIEMRPSKGKLPKRTFFQYPKYGRTFVQNDLTKKISGVIEYLPAQSKARRAKRVLIP